jgi:hypothetical protein
MDHFTGDSLNHLQPDYRLLLGAVPSHCLPTWSLTCRFSLIPEELPALDAHTWDQMACCPESDRLSRMKASFCYSPSGPSVHEPVVVEHDVDEQDHRRHGKRIGWQKALCCQRFVLLTAPAERSFFESRLKERPNESAPIRQSHGI